MKQLFLLSFFLPLLANAEEPRLLLQCQIGIAPLSAVKVFEVDGLLTVHEQRLGYPYKSRELAREQWQARRLELLDLEDEITGVLAKSGRAWNYTFLRSDGWRMTGGADCYEASGALY